MQSYSMNTHKPAHKTVLFRSGGFEKYWEAKQKELARHGRRVSEVQGMADWVLGDPTAKHKEQCAKYVADAAGAEGGLLAHQSEHASFQIVTPAITLRLNHGWIAYEGWRDPTDTFNYPDHEVSGARGEIRGVTPALGGIGPSSVETAHTPP